MSDLLKDIAPLTYEEHQLSTGVSAIIYDKSGIAIDGHNTAEQCGAIVQACNAYPDLVEALEQIAGNNWKDQSRAKHIARQALAKLDAQS